MSSELQRIALLARHFGALTGAGISVGIGDDCAVLDPTGASRLVWTIDAQVDGTHFRLDWLDWEDVGWRSFMAAASDLAAMAATPLAALSALALSDAVDDPALEALARGQAEAARVVGAPIVGGNLARGTETSITTTLLGRVATAVLRSGAKPGDGLYLAGAVGMAAAGLRALAGGKPLGTSPSLDACIMAWRRPRALIDAGQSMGAVAHAAVDVSDGLARDAWHVAEASDVVLVIEEQALRARSAGVLDLAAKDLGVDALDFMLGGGEDYALLVASPSPIFGFDRIGSVAVGPAALMLARADGTRSALDPRGFDHFG